MRASAEDRFWAKVNRTAAITHCPYGHAYTPENTRLRDNGGYKTRRCKICQRAADSARHKAAAMALRGEGDT